jgi:protein O-mannosyl-transferase
LATDRQFATYNPHSRWRAAEIAPVLVLTLWAYWGCLKNPFHFDDALFLQSPQVTEPGDPLFLLKPSQSRQLSYLSLFMNYRLGGRNPGGYHLFNLIVHLANALGIYVLVRLLCAGKPDLSDAMIRRWLPLTAAGIFALHPIQSQAVNYIYQRSTLLAAFFTIAAMCAFLWSERARRRGPFLLLAGLLFILAAASKESGLVLPLVLLTYSWCYQKEPKPLWSLPAVRRFLVALGALSLGGVAYILYNLYSIGDRTLGLLQSGPLRYLTSQVTVIVTYLRLVLWPAGLSVDHDFTAVSPRSSYFWFCALLLITVLAVAVRLRNRSPSTSFLVLAFFILLAPTSSIVPSADLMFEHRLYLPMITGSIVLALALIAVMGSIIKTSRWREAAFAICALLLLVGYAAASKKRTFLWGNNVRLWTDAVMKAPGKARVRYNLGVSYLAVDRGRARSEFLRTLELRPDHAAAMYNLGWLEQTEGRFESARRYYRAALKVDASNWQAHHNLGNLAVIEGNLAEAMTEFRETIRLKPEYWPARQTVATLQLQQKDYSSARVLLERLKSEQPDILEIRYLLSYALVGGKRFAEAEEELRLLASNDRDGRYKGRIENLRRVMTAKP